MYNSCDVTMYFNIFLFIRKVEAIILIQRWWREMTKRKMDNIRDIIIR